MLHIAHVDKSRDGNSVTLEIHDENGLRAADVIVRTEDFATACTEKDPTNYDVVVVEVQRVENDPPVRFVIP